MRKNIIEILSYEKVYNQGFNINTPINLELQKIATDSLRDGLVAYDKRKGWRGPLTNKTNIKNWSNDLEKYDLESSIDWNIAIVKKITKFSAEIETKDRTKGLIEFQDISWTKKEFNELLKKGDVIYVKHIKENKYSLKQIPKINGGIVVMDPYTGRVLALSGGFSFKNSEFNRASQALRQPGSAFKPFVYALALENNYTPSSLVLDAPLVLAQGSDLKMWKPENYGKKFYGPSTLRIGLEKSRNVMTVRLANQLGMSKITEIGERFKLGRFPPLLATSLGAEEVTLLDLVAAYAVFVNGGRYNKPALIEKIQDRKGKTLFKRDKRICRKCQTIQEKNFVRPLLSPEGEQIVKAPHAFQLTWILKGVTERGTAKSLKKLKYSLAGKTGTTNNNMDAWFLGFSPELVVGVFIGYDKPKTLGDKETGGKVAVPIFADFIKKALKNYENRPFLVPENIEMIKIDRNSGDLEISDSKNTIYEAFLKGSTNVEKDSNLYKKEIIKGFEDNLY